MTFGDVNCGSLDAPTVATMKERKTGFGLTHYGPRTISDL